MTRFRSPLIPLLAVAAMGGVAPAALATNGYFSHAFGTKSEGVAGAGIAYSQDTLTIATNPAGLVAIDGGYDLGITAFRPDRGATLTQGGTSASFDGNATKTFLIPALGYSRHLGDRWAVGVAVYGNGGMNTDYASNPFARFGARGTAGVDFTQAFVSPAVAWRLNDQNSLGLAVNLAYQKFKGKGVGLFAPFSSSPTNLSDRAYDSATGASVRLGWQGQVTPDLTLGATWQSKGSTSAFKKYAGLFADGGGFDIPSTWGLGVGYRVTKDWQVALDWQRINYSEVGSVGNSVASLFQGQALGVANGPGFGWHDVSVVKLGTTYKASDALTLRAGYSHNQQPVQARETFFNILAPGVVRDHFTVGASWAITPASDVSLSYLHAPRNTVHGSGSIPAAFGGGEADVSLAESSLGVGFSHRF